MMMRLLVVLALGSAEAFGPMQRRARLAGRATAEGRAVAVRAGAVAEGDDSGLVASGTTNLVKSIVGAGVLALPAGVAAFADAPAALVPAALVVAGLGAASMYSFQVLGRVCAAYGATDYRDAWSKSVGESSAFIVNWFVTLTPLLACVSYSMIIGDAFAALIATAKPSPQVLAALGLLGGTRKACISLVSALALFPLCSLKSLKALAPTSALGTAGVVYTTIFMIIRALDGSYAPGGKFAMALAAAGGVAPKFGAGIMARPARLGVFVAMLGTAFMAHFNAPSFYTEAIKLSTFSKLVTRGFGFSVLLNVLIMVAGFGTFGAACNGLVLNNYATTDTLAGLARALFGVSIVFTFPLAFAGSKAGMREVLGKVLPKKSEALETAVVALPLALITAVALVLDDVGAVVSLTGALMGSAIIYILPAIMLLKGEKLDRSPLEKRAVPYAMMLLGAVSATLGVYTTLA